MTWSSPNARVSDPGSRHLVPRPPRPRLGDAEHRGLVALRPLRPRQIGDALQRLRDLDSHTRSPRPSAQARPTCPQLILLFKVVRRCAPKNDCHNIIRQCARAPPRLPPAVHSEPKRQRCPRLRSLHVLDDGQPIARARMNGSCCLLDPPLPGVRTAPTLGLKFLPGHGTCLNGIQLDTPGLIAVRRPPCRTTVAVDAADVTRS
jgi:hypothetical protein